VTGALLMLLLLKTRPLSLVNVERTRVPQWQRDRPAGTAAAHVYEVSAATGLDFPPLDGCNGALYAADGHVRLTSE
jgi:hypothetical protein